MRVGCWPGLPGCALAVPGFAPDPVFALVINAISGIGVGLVSVYAVTWLQSKATEAMHGRLASLIVFASVALDPLSQGVSGFISEIDLTLLFVASGLLMIMTGVLTALSPTIRQRE